MVVAAGRDAESALVGSLGWTSPRMLARCRPFDDDRAKEQHTHHNPLNLAELELGATQPRMLWSKGTWTVRKPKDASGT